MDYLDDMDPTGECEYEIFNNSLKKKQLLLAKQDMYVVQQYFLHCVTLQYVVYMKVIYIITI